MNLGKFFKTKGSPGYEKHLPIIEIGRGHRSEDPIVRVIVCKEGPHKMAEEHHVAYVELFGVKEGQNPVALGRAAFNRKLTKPNVRFCVDPSEFDSLVAIAYCRIHGIWINEVEVPKT